MNVEWESSSRGKRHIKTAYVVQYRLPCSHFQADQVQSKRNVDAG